MRDLVTVASALIVAVVGAGGVTALLLVRYQKRLLGATARREDAVGRHEDADAAAQMSSAAAELLKPYREDLASARAEARTAREDAERANRRANVSERRIARLEQLGGLHMLWDQEAQAEVERLGGHLRPPPQLDDITA